MNSLAYRLLEAEIDAAISRAKVQYAEAVSACHSAEMIETLMRGEVLPADSPPLLIAPPRKDGAS